MKRILEHIVSWPARVQMLFVVLLAVVVTLTIVFIVRPLWVTETGTPPEWTGFGPDADYPAAIHVGIVLPAKNLWDWLQLIIVPASVAILVAWFNRRDKLRDERQHAQDQEREATRHAQDQEREETRHKQDQEREETRHKQDQEREENRQQEAILEGYLDRMAGLMLNTPLLADQTDRAFDVARNLAHARTVTALRRLDSRRNQSMLSFLKEAELIQKSRPIVDLSKTDLSGAKLAYANLSDAYLGGADLSGADLRWAVLLNTKLVKTDLSEAKLAYAHLTGADLTGADLTGADLTQAIITNDQLKLVRSLKGAIMRDGTPYTGGPPVGQPPGP